MPFSDILSQFNWIDILVVTVLLRTSYVGSSQGFIIEIFKLSGAIASCYFTLHYYSWLGSFLADKTPVPASACNIFSYLAISFLILIFFVLLRHSFLSMIKVEPVYLLNMWGGVVLGFIRGVFTVSLICVFFIVSGAGYLKGSVGQAYFGSKVVRVAPATYKFIFNGLVVKFVPENKLNHSLFEVLSQDD